MIGCTCSRCQDEWRVVRDPSATEEPRPPRQMVVRPPEPVGERRHRLSPTRRQASTAGVSKRAMSLGRPRIKRATTRHDDDCQCGGCPRHHLDCQCGWRDDDRIPHANTGGTMPAAAPALFMACKNCRYGRSVTALRIAFCPPDIARRYHPSTGSGKPLALTANSRSMPRPSRTSARITLGPRQDREVTGVGHPGGEVGQVRAVGPPGVRCHRVLEISDQVVAERRAQRAELDFDR